MSIALMDRQLELEIPILERDYTKDISQEINRFKEDLPYKWHPFTKRNWGHPLHSLCSYQGKLKPAIAHFLVKNFTSKNDVVLDPFCGVGTIPYEACLQGRVGIGVDINPVAYHNTLAKVSPIEPEGIEKVLCELQDFMDKCNITDEEVEKSNISNINGSLKDYYEKNTFIEILKARKFFLEKTQIRTSSSDSFVIACMLHILHGNRPYALSRRSHGITPFSPKGDFVYKPVLNHLRQKIELMLRQPVFNGFIHGYAYKNSVFNLPSFDKPIDCLITSPPFLHSTRFYTSNWIRFWFCGWENEDFKNGTKSEFLEIKQAKDISIYRDVFSSLRQVIKDNGLCIFHLGVVKDRDMGIEISPFAKEAGFEILDLVYEDVRYCESHGISDQGSTNKHQFLFLRKQEK